MKINFIYTLIALAISFLISYAFYSFYGEQNRLLITGGTFLMLSIPLLMAFAVKLKDLPRTTIHVKTVSVIMFFTALIANIVFALIDFKKEWYIIICGILLLMYIALIYSLFKTRQ